MPTNDQPGMDEAGRARRASPFVRAVNWIGRLTVTLAVVGVMMLLVGFVWFYAQIPGEEIKLDGRADGIVVLTGGADRIPDALELLAQRRGERLLITGVHRSARDREVAEQSPAFKSLFACCVDLDRSALNTVGNALETKRWATERGFRSLIVVTSNWHMPRAMAELRHHMPDTALIAYPVITEKLKNEPWLSNATTARLLISEYLKYLFAIVRLHLDADAA